MDTFYALTLRQIIYLKKAIEKRKNIELEIKASLHGKKIKESMKPLDITPEEDRESDKAAEKLLQRMKEQHGKRSRITDTDKRDG